MVETKAGHTVKIEPYSRTDRKYPALGLYAHGIGAGFVPEHVYNGFDVTETGKKVSVVHGETVVWSREVRSGLFAKTRERATTLRANHKANRLNRRAA